MDFVVWGVFRVFLFVVDFFMEFENFGFNYIFIKYF